MSLLSSKEKDLLNYYGVIDYLSESKNYPVLERMITLAARYYPYYKTMSYVKYIKAKRKGTACTYTPPQPANLVKALFKAFDPYNKRSKSPRFPAYKRLAIDCSLVLIKDPKEKIKVRKAVVKHVLDKHWLEIKRRSIHVRNPLKP
jgi:hypothetical protein